MGLKFTINIPTGLPGSIHDSRVLRHTALYQITNNNEILLKLKVYVNGHQIGPMLLGGRVNLL